MKVMLWILGLLAVLILAAYIKKNKDWKLPETILNILKTYRELILIISNIILVLVTCVIAIANCSLAEVSETNLGYTREALDISRKTNERAEMLFIEQIRPQISVIPNLITQNGTHPTTSIKVTNSSGFLAKNILVDVKYGDNSWIGEWSIANAKAKLQKYIQNNAKEFILNVDNIDITPNKIPLLKPGETEQKKFGGELNLEMQVCSKGQEGFPIYVRVTWQNEYFRPFNEIHEYQLICTINNNENDPDAGRGRTFKFIPKGIVSRKE